MQKDFKQYFGIMFKLLLVLTFCYLTILKSHAQTFDKKYFENKTLYYDGTLSTYSLMKDTLNLIDYPNYTYEFCESHSSSELPLCKNSKTIALEFCKKNKLKMYESNSEDWTITLLKVKLKWRIDKSDNSLIIYSKRTGYMRFKAGDEKTVNFKSNLNPSERSLKIVKLINVKAY